MAPIGQYAADGSINVTVVSGATTVGRVAADGSLNVVSTGTASATVRSVNHPSGATWVTLDNTGPNSANAADGTMNVTTTPYAGKGAERVTVVSGSLP